MSIFSTKMVIKGIKVNKKKSSKKLMDWYLDDLIFIKAIVLKQIW